MSCQYLISVDCHILDDVISVVLVHCYCHCVALFVAYTIEAPLIACCVYYNNFFSRRVYCYNNTFSCLVVVNKSCYYCFHKDNHYQHCYYHCIIHHSLHNLVPFFSYTVSIEHCVLYLLTVYLHLLLLCIYLFLFTLL